MMKKKKKHTTNVECLWCAHQASLAMLLISDTLNGRCGGGGTYVYCIFTHKKPFFCQRYVIILFIVKPFGLGSTKQRNFVCVSTVYECAHSRHMETSKKANAKYFAFKLSRKDEKQENKLRIRQLHYFVAKNTIVTNHV